MEGYLQMHNPKPVAPTDDRVSSSLERWEGRSPGGRLDGERWVMAGCYESAPNDVVKNEKCLGRFISYVARGSTIYIILYTESNNQTMTL